MHIRNIHKDTHVHIGTHTYTIHAYKYTHIYVHICTHTQFKGKLETQWQPLNSAMKLDLQRQNGQGHSLSHHHHQPTGSLPLLPPCTQMGKGICWKGKGCLFPQWSVSGRALLVFRGETEVKNRGATT